MSGNDDLVIMVSAGEVDCGEATEVIEGYEQIGEDGDDIPGTQVGDYHCGTADGPGNTAIYDTLVSCTAEDGRQRCGLRDRGGTGRDRRLPER